MIHSFTSRLTLRYLAALPCMSLAPLAPFRLLCAAIKFAVQRHGKGDLAASHYDVTAALPHTFKAVGNEQIAQLRAREEAQLRHASLRVL